jgi:hypothetical protein
VSDDIYFKIEPLNFGDCGVIGFFYRGHIDMEQWKGVATEYLKNEYESEVSKYTSFRKGWYKVLPNRRMVLLTKHVSGSFPVMECVQE